MRLEGHLSAAKRFVHQAGASLSEGGWRERGAMLEPPLGGGSGEPCGK